MLDTLMVGTLGEAEMAAVSAANTPTFAMELLIFGLQSGSAVLISQFWGKGDRRSISRVVGIGGYIAGAVSIVFATLLMAFPSQTMALFAGEQNLIDIGAEYIGIVGLSYVFMSITAIYTALHRGTENPRLGLYIFGTGMVVGTFVDWILIFGHFGVPAMGVRGAAIGTLVAHVLEFIIMIFHAIYSKRFRINVRAMLRPGKPLIAKYIKYSSPVLVNETLWGLGTALFPTIMGHMDNSQQILAAHTIAGNVADMASVVVFAVAGSSAIIIGREIGRGNRDKVYEIGSALNGVSVIVGFVMGLIMIVLNYTIMDTVVFPFFKLSPLSATISTMMMTVYGLCLTLRSFNSTNIVGVLRGGGDVKAATLIDCLPLWCVSVPLAAILGLVFRVDMTWVYLAMMLDTLIKSFFGVGRFRSKKWINDVTAGIEIFEYDAALAAVVE